jgi:DnaJ-class molecular chaperone
VFGLGVEATLSQVKASRNKLAWIYHPDVQKSEMTGLTLEGAKQYMQMINRAYKLLLHEYFERG